MGAYSSWASLALTHHVLVNSLYEPLERRKYAILGDDMTVESRKGPQYLSIMAVLGVPVSVAKSLPNSNFIEFAKKLFNKTTGDLDAVIGPRLILRSIQNRLLKVTVLHDSYKRRLIDSPGLFEKLCFGPSKEGAFSFGHYLLYGP